MSDEDYASFLDKANQDTGASKGKKKEGEEGETKMASADVPAELVKIDSYYVSETDEPFEGVSLRWEGSGLPSAEGFKSLVDHGGEVEELSVKEFDPQGEYGEVMDAVKGAGSGKVKIFRVDTGRTRAEYYVVSVDRKGGRIVGLKAKAVES